VQRCFLAIGSVFVCLLGLVSCEKPLNLDANALLEAGKARDVRILRDTWGVPHIFGATDADVAYGLAYAHAEDDFKTIQEAALMGLGMLSSVKGRDEAPIDYMVKLLRISSTVDEKYETGLRPETRALCEAYAEGINLYAALHPDEVLRKDLFPASGKDIVANFAFICPFFYRLDNEVKALFKKTRQHPLSTKSDVAELVPGDPGIAVAKHLMTHDTEIGSNTIAARHRDRVEHDCRRTEPVGGRGHAYRHQLASAVDGAGGVVRSPSC